MHWRTTLLTTLMLISVANAWMPIPSIELLLDRKTGVLPYLGIMLCPMQTDSRACFQQQVSKILDIFEYDAYSDWLQLKADADRQVNATSLPHRDASGSMTALGGAEKPSSILNKIEMTVKFLRAHMPAIINGLLEHHRNALEITKDSLEHNNGGDHLNDRGSRGSLNATPALNPATGDEYESFLVGRDADECQQDNYVTTSTAAALQRHHVATTASDVLLRPLYNSLQYNPPRNAVKISKYYQLENGRSYRGIHGKKKKKKKALVKIILLGTFLKAKIELLLKLLSAHLQFKFLAIALIGLLVNIARFWIDVKHDGPAKRVVYVEHAHHQHHYEDGEEWNEPGGGGAYWKRSLQSNPAIPLERRREPYLSGSHAAESEYTPYNSQWL